MLADPTVDEDRHRTCSEVTSQRVLPTSDVMRRKGQLRSASEATASRRYPLNIRKTASTGDDLGSPTSDCTPASFLTKQTSGAMFAMIFTDCRKSLDDTRACRVDDFPASSEGVDPLAVRHARRRIGDEVIERMTVIGNLGRPVLALGRAELTLQDAARRSWGTNRGQRGPVLRARPLQVDVVPASPRKRYRVLPLPPTRICPRSPTLRKAIAVPVAGADGAGVDVGLAVASAWLQLSASVAALWKMGQSGLEMFRRLCRWLQTRRRRG